MDDPIVQSFAKIADDLREFIDKNRTLPDPEAGFTYFIGSQQDTVNSARCNLPQWPTATSFKHPQALACFGFLVATNRGYHKSLHAEWKSELKSNLSRDLFPIDRQSFTFRPVEVVGIALGAKTLLHEESPLRSELSSIVRRCRNEANRDLFSSWLYWYAEQLLSDATSPPPEIENEDRSIGLCGLIYWINSQSVACPTIGADLILAIEDELLTQTVTAGFARPELPDAALVLDGLERATQRRLRSRLNETAIVSATTQDAIEFVKRISRNFPLYARQLLKRRKDVKIPGNKDKQARPTIVMNDEYDVQDSLHAILRLFFDDVRDEVWTPSYADNQNRIDFVLPAYHIAIEVKHTGKSLTQRKISDQLIIDKEYYRQETTCNHLICFVYDPDLRLKNPVAIETDLSVDDEDFGVEVVISPK